MEKLLDDLLFSPMMRSGDVTRYGCTKLQETETLSTHLADISMLAYLIALEHNNASTDKVDMGKLLEKCLLHDLDEVITGDIPRNTKYASPTAHDAFDVIAKVVVTKLASGVAKGNNEIVDIWENSKSGTEGLILKIADMLCVVRKAMIEVNLYHNYSALKIISELPSHLTGLLSYLIDSDLDAHYLITLVESALDDIVQMKSEHSSFIYRFGIDKTIL